ncbi:exodeoxyribonuclease I [Stenotrophomonas mori]|uniref:Exodeoxyribonuclease I n=1 Tax=Stenotrophomonas mori TaxID=2871096 RepID=A0ABT0SFX3_9GAMM|nr:exodeoxyribonuclease I [Stenotrophomonas mori]MCL7713968.1 exodeoxyribonuclease I [Stenotrophomonas mori]
MADSFLFYDLETFGQDPRRTRIAQFAAVRTDMRLQPVEEPVSFFVRPADDLLPSPIATLITGITPQHALAEGVTEAEAFARIHELMARPQTCTLGYNTLRFDDEFVRHGLFRNFFDPYEREWRSGNSRWDLLDMLRLAHALRPDGIAWPAREDGAPSFKLEHLALANGVRQGDAHEALSDVYATLGMARKFRQAQPRLWEYALKLRDKRFAASLLDVVGMRPALHVSMRYPASRLCAAAVLPLATHPHIGNRVIVFDLDGDPQALLDLSAEEIAQRLYTRAADLPEGQPRIPLKEVHLNKVPALVAWNHLRAPDFERLGIDPQAVEARAAQLRAHGPELAEKVRRVFARDRPDAAPPDPDGALYDGFLAEGDRAQLARVRTCPPPQLAQMQDQFRDPRLPELLFRYRARNHPQTLDAGERARWDGYRRQRLFDTPGLGEQLLPDYVAQILALRQEHHDAPASLALLDALERWGQTVQDSL